MLLRIPGDYKRNRKVSSSATALPVGQCRLTFVSSTSLKLIPMRGNALKVAGSWFEVPAAGVSIANTGLSASTLYYAYAFISSGSIALELSTTTHATDTSAGNIGVEIKSGDSSRSFLGWVRTTSGSQFADSLTQRFVISFHNPVWKPLFIALQSTTTASTSFVEASTSLRMEFVAGNENLVDIYYQGHIGNSGAEPSGVSIGLDGTTPLTVTVDAQPTAGGFFYFSGHVRYTDKPSEGYHFSTLLLFSSVAGNTAAWTGGGAGGVWG